MTMKNIKKNISAEDFMTIFDIEIPKVDNEPTSILITRKNFYTDVAGSSDDLLDFFYTKKEIDDKIRLHIEKYNSYNDLPIPGKDNYIYLVPFNSPTDTQEGVYKEYRWVPKENGRYTDPQTNIKYDYEAFGSTQIDLTDMQLISNMIIAWSSTPSTTKYPSESLVVSGLNTKVDKVQGKQLSTNDFTNDYKNKLDGIEAQANKTIVDSDLNANSPNPVQNKKVKAALDAKVDKETGKTLTSNDFTNSYKNIIDNLKKVAKTGLYDDLDNLPIIPTKTSDLINDSDFVTSIDVSEAANATDSVQDANPRPVSSNGVYDYFTEVLTEFKEDLVDPSSYIIQDTEEPALQISLIEILDTMIDLMNGDYDDSSE